MRNKKIIGILICMLLIATAFPAVESLKNSVVMNPTISSSSQTSMAENWIQLQKLLASDGAVYDGFGISVSISGDTALIGAIFSVYVFTRTGTTWTQQAKLLASDGTQNNFFGYSVSLSGNTALIGAPGIVDPKYHYPGYAYVFTRTGTIWTQQQKLLASDSVADDGFGNSVSLSGDTVLIGAPGIDSAYVFTCTGITWTQQQKLLASDSAMGFGSSVFLSGDTALIGAPYYNSDTGSAYVFTCTGITWTQQAKLLASDGTANNMFGCSVSISGDTALIGAFNYNSAMGSAYVFTCTGITWTQQQKLLASDGAANNYFGCSVSLSSDTVLIGAPGYNSMIGAAYVFIKNSPNPPIITGPASGKVGKTTNYVFTTTDPQGDQVYYYIEWGDGQISVWIGPYASGAAQTISHTWSTKGTYTIRAKAKDIHDAESGWTTLAVSMPKDKGINLFFTEFLQKLLQRFPFFEKILNLYYN